MKFQLEPWPRTDNVSVADISAGDGYRRLDARETIKRGDEFLLDGIWRPVKFSIDDRVGRMIVRRKIVVHEFPVGCVVDLARDAAPADIPQRALAIKLSEGFWRCRCGDIVYLTQNGDSWVSNNGWWYDSTGHCSGLPMLDIEKRWGMTTSPFVRQDDAIAFFKKQLAVRSMEGVRHPVELIDVGHVRISGKWYTYKDLWINFRDKDGDPVGETLPF